MMNQRSNTIKSGRPVVELLCSQYVQSGIRGMDSLAFLEKCLNFGLQKEEHFLELC